MKESASAKKMIAHPKPYFLRVNDLTSDEINAINHYKDLINEQLKWDYEPIERYADVGIDCQMINGYLRENIPEKNKILTDNDKNKLNRLINTIDCAILKSRPHKILNLYKGVGMFPDLKKVKRDSEIKDGAFASFTVDLEIAANYSKENENGEYIFYHIKITPENNALYLDDDEDEWLLRRGDNTVIRIDHVENFAGKSKAIIYHIERTNR